MRDKANSRQEALDNILRLRRAERRADDSLRVEIATAREYLEDILGPTVRPADAARSLGISLPALTRWLDKGEISAVTTPGGRRQVPLAELVELVDEVERKRAAGYARPVAEAIKERKQRSTETVDIARLLPRRRPRSHRTAELQALAYHRLVAERLTRELVDEAKRRLKRWERDGRIDPRWAREWERLLDSPIPRIARTISTDSKRSAELRQSSPLAGLLTPQERRRLTGAVEVRSS
jgi:excisionase family DNA binding protein